jgi:hypothetical protein
MTECRPHERGCKVQATPDTPRTEPTGDWIVAIDFVGVAAPDWPVGWIMTGR